MLAPSPAIAYWAATSIVMALTAANVFLQRIELLWLCPFTFYVSLRLIGCGSLCFQRATDDGSSSSSRQLLETPEEEEEDDDRGSDAGGDEEQARDGRPDPNSLTDDEHDTLLEDLGSAFEGDYSTRDGGGAGAGADDDNNSGNGSSDSDSSMPSLLHIEHFKGSDKESEPSAPPARARARAQPEVHQTPAPAQEENALPLSLVPRKRSNAVTEDCFFDLEVGDEQLSPIFESKLYGFHLDTSAPSSCCSSGGASWAWAWKKGKLGGKRKRQYTQPLQPQPIANDTYGTFTFARR